MKVNVTEAASAARGRWPHILPALGLKVVENRHMPCPVCQGNDRFRFDDQDGRGMWICNHCGAGDSLTFVEKALSISLSEAAARVSELSGSLPAVHPETLCQSTANEEDARAAAGQYGERRHR